MPEDNPQSAIPSEEPSISKDIRNLELTNLYDRSERVRKIVADAAKAGNPLLRDVRALVRQKGLELNESDWDGVDIEKEYQDLVAGEVEDVCIYTEKADKAILRKLPQVKIRDLPVKSIDLDYSADGVVSDIFKGPVYTLILQTDQPPEGVGAPGEGLFYYFKYTRDGWEKSVETEVADISSSEEMDAHDLETAGIALHILGEYTNAVFQAPEAQAA